MRFFFHRKKVKDVLRSCLAWKEYIYLPKKVNIEEEEKFSWIHLLKKSVLLNEFLLTSSELELGIFDSFVEKEIIIIKTKNNFIINFTCDDSNLLDIWILGLKNHTHI